MAASRDKLTYRVRQIPYYMQSYDVQRLLQNVLQYDGTVNVHSLATAVDSFEHPAPMVATVTFLTKPLRLNDSTRTEWVFAKSQTSLPYNLVIDTHFNGFTVLNEVQQHNMECIAITGLAGHAFGSWSDRSHDVDFMWLRDAVPKRYSNIRVLTYGYDTQLIESKSFQSIEDLSLSLINGLRAVNLAEPSTNPIIVIAHSLGGIVVKQAFALMAGNPSLSENLLSKIKKVVFFGVPNQGMQTAHLMPMVRDGANKQLVESLAIGSEYLKSLDDQFFGFALTRQIELVSVYETHETQVPKFDQGRWQRVGSWEVLVQKQSAIQRGTPEFNRYPINKDHSNLVKFTETDSALLSILQFLGTTSSRVTDAQMTSEDSVQTDLEGDSIASGSVFTGGGRLSQAKDILTSKKSRLRTHRALCAKVTKSLKTGDLDLRYQSVELAHATTLQWVFSKETSSLVDWLESGTGIFWISGKPGSGKSTVMKQITRHYKATLSSENSWNMQISARFFMSLRGNVLQKSFEGLLRSLLEQILTSSPTLAESIIDRQFAQRFGSHFQWSMNELEHMWDLLLHQKTYRVGITLFLDALDEFDGPAERVARFVQSLAYRPRDSMTQIRVCCSSRPWDAFRDRFAKCEGFIVEENTGTDISNYVWTIARQHNSMGSIMQHASTEDRRQVEKLLNKIIEQAQGVFLWVRFVLDEVLDKRAEGSEIEELVEAIQSLPNELETLYETILERLRTKKERHEAYVMLEILVRADGPMTLFELFCAFKCAFAKDIESCARLLQSYKLASRMDADVFQRRIKSRCGGMIEIMPMQNFGADPSILPIIRPDTDVQLMHQSVKDFVLGPNFTVLLTNPEDTLASQNGYSFTAKLGLARIYGVGRCEAASTNDLRESKIARTRNLHSFVYSVQQAEQTTGKCQDILIDDIPDSHFSAFFGQIPLYYQHIDSRLAFGLILCLELYIDSRFTNSSHRASPKEWFDGSMSLIKYITNRQGSELHRESHARVLKYIHFLDALSTRKPQYLMFKQQNMNLLQAFCFHSNIDHDMIIESEHITTDFRRCTPLVPFVCKLVSAGHDPNTKLFAPSVTLEQFYRDPSPDLLNALHLAFSIPEAVNMLLRYGADPNSLSGRGQTPMDLAVFACSEIIKQRRYWIRDEEEIHTEMKQLRTSIQILMRHGGKTTMQSDFFQVGKNHTLTVSGLIEFLQDGLPAEFQLTVAWSRFVACPILEDTSSRPVLHIGELPHLDPPLNGEYGPSVSRIGRKVSSTVDISD